MLLAIDVGNSNTVFGLWDNAQWRYQWRIETSASDDVEDYTFTIQQFIDKINGDTTNISSVIISSVVPKVTEPLTKALNHFFGRPPMLLDAQTDTGITLKAEHPDRVGADLIAGAVGAYAIAQETCIVIDFGTATTIMAVKKPGVLTGGAICAGLKASISTLVSKTAQLPTIPIKIPDSPLGKNTVEAMQSGLVLGHLCMVEGLIDRMKKELGPAKVVATGGLVSLLAPHTDYFDFVEPLLTLDGLRIIAERQE